MKAAKIIGIGCGGCLGLVVVACLVGYMWLPSSYEVSRSIAIDAPPNTVFPLVNTPARWPEWDPWQRIDPNMKNSTSGPESGVGAKRDWDSTNPEVGKGSFEITESVPNERVVTLVVLPEYDSTSTGTFVLERTANGTQVTWTSNAEDLSGVMKVMSILMEQMLGPMFEDGLGNLKELAESEVDVGDVLMDKADQILDDVLDGPDGE